MEETLKRAMAVNQNTQKNSFVQYAEDCLNVLSRVVADKESKVDPHWLVEISQKREGISGSLKDLLSSFFTGDHLSEMHRSMKTLALEQRMSPEVIKLLQTIFAPCGTQTFESLHSFGALYNDGGMRNGLFFHILPSLMRWQCLGVNTVAEVASPALLTVTEQAWDYKLGGTTYLGYGESATYNMAKLLNALLDAHLEYPEEFNERSFKNVLNWVRGSIVGKAGPLKGNADHVPDLIQSTLNVYDHLEDSELKRDFNPFKWVSFALSRFDVDYKECQSWTSGEPKEVWDELLSREDLKKFNDGLWAWCICEAVPLKYFPEIKQLVDQADNNWWLAFYTAHSTSGLYSVQRINVEEVSAYTLEKPYDHEGLDRLKENLGVLDVQLKEPLDNAGRSLGVENLLKHMGLDESYKLLCTFGLMLERMSEPLPESRKWKFVDGLLGSTELTCEWVENSERSSLKLNKDEFYTPTTAAFWNCFKSIMDTGDFKLNASGREKREDLVYYLLRHASNSVPDFAYQEVLKVEGWQNSPYLAEISVLNVAGAQLFEQSLRKNVQPVEEKKAKVEFHRF